VKTFTLNRVVDETGVSGTGNVAQGVVFDDGTCVLRWLTATPGTTVFASVEAMLEVHGHGGKTKMVYGAERPATKRSDSLTKTRRFPGRGGKRETSIAKLDRERQIVYGVVLDPYIVDAHDDWISPREVELTAHGYMERARRVRLQHQVDLSAVVVESFVFWYPTPDDYAAAVDGRPHRIWKMQFGNDLIHSGAWVLGVRVLDPTAWAKVLSGELGAYSIGGFGVRTEIERVPMPEVEVLTIEAPTS